MQIRSTLFAIILLNSAIQYQLRAQEGSKTSIGNSAVKKTISDATEKTPVFLFPDFFHNDVKKDKDTTWAYEFYDTRLQRIYAYALKNVDEIDHIKYNKIITVPMSAGNSTVTSGARYTLVYKLVHPSPDIWLKVEGHSSEITRYKLHMNKIVRTEKVNIINPLTNKPQRFIYKYFKTEEISRTMAEGYHQH